MRFALATPRLLIFQIPPPLHIPPFSKNPWQKTLLLPNLKNSITLPPPPRLQTLGPFCRLYRAMTMTATTTRVVPVKEKIDLTDKESQIFEQLLQVVRHFNLQTQLRVAGGWVRDKVSYSFLSFFLCT